MGDILAADPFHLPTYYLLLQPIVGFFPPGNELALRLIHALIFSIGLGFCWRIARSLLGCGRALWGVMILTILLPNYIFYATNIRMYALLFSASLAFLWTAFRLLTPGVPKRRAMTWHLLAALVCALVEWQDGGQFGRPGQNVDFSTRPLSDLVYAAVYPLLLHGLLWLLLVLAVSVAAVVLWRGGDRRLQLVTIPAAVGAPGL